VIVVFVVVFSFGVLSVVVRLAVAAALFAEDRGHDNVDDLRG